MTDSTAERGPDATTSSVTALGPLRLTRLIEALACPRVAIGGGPDTGKTRMAQRFNDRPVVHGYEFEPQGWDPQPQLLIEACRGLDRFVVEGLHVARALRKGLEVDAIVWLQWAQVPDRTDRQRSTAKGCRTIFDRYLEQRPRHAPPVLYPTLEEVREFCG